MADLLFEIAMRDDATPVLKNVRLSSEEAGRGLASAAQRASGGLQQMTDKTRTAGQAALNMTSAVTPLRQALTDAASVSSGFSNALVNIVRFGFNPVALAIAGAVSAVGLLTSAWEEGTRASEDFKKSFAEHGDALAIANAEYRAQIGLVSGLDAALTRFRQSQAAQELQSARDRVSKLQSVIGALPGGKDSISQFMRGLIGFSDDDLKQAQNQLAALESLFSAREKAFERGFNTRESQQAASKSSSFAQSLFEQNNAVEKQLIEMTKGAGAAEEWSLKQVEAKAAAAGLTGEIQQQIDRARDLAEQTRAAKDRLLDLKNSLAGFEEFPEEFNRTRLSPADTSAALAATKQFQDARKAATESALTSLAELERQLTLELTDESLRRVVVVNQESDARIAAINKWKVEANASFAAGTLSLNEYILAWRRLDQAAIDTGESAAKKLKEDTQTMTESLAQAAQSSVQLLSNLVNGSLKTAEDFGRAALTIVLQLVGKLTEAQLLFSLTGGKQGANILGNLISPSVGSAAQAAATNIANHPNVAAPSAALPVDFEKWTIDAMTGFEQLNETVSTGLQSLLNSSSAGFGSFFSQLGGSFAEGLGSLTNSVSSLVSSLLSGISNSFSSGGGSGGGFGSFFGDLIGSLFAHEGGLIGSSAVPTRHVPAAAFAGAPRFHSGGDVPAILQSGEYVMRRPAVQAIGAGNLDRMNRTGEMPGGGNPVSVNVQINGDITPRRPEMKKDDIVKVVVQSMRDHGLMYHGIRDYGPKD